MNQKTDIEYLEDFIHSNPELERLESLVDEFNIFTSLKIIDAEIRHSNFLAWLLDPSETHGLGSYFLKSFLKRVAYRASQVVLEYPTIFEVDGWDLDQAEVYREWRNIDILIADSANRFACVIENKITSSEHSSQLQRYKEIVDAEYPKYRKLLLYLTVEGETPRFGVYN